MTANNGSNFLLLTILKIITATILSHYSQHLHWITVVLIYIYAYMYVILYTFLLFLVNKFAYTRTLYFLLVSLLQIREVLRDHFHVMFI